MHISFLFAVPTGFAWIALSIQAFLSWIVGFQIPFSFSGEGSFEEVMVGVVSACFVIAVGLHFLIAYVVRRDWFGESAYGVSFVGFPGAAVSYCLWLLGPSSSLIGHAFFICAMLLYGAVWRGFANGNLFAKPRVRTRTRLQASPPIAQQGSQDIARASHPKTSFKDIFGNAEIKARLKDAAQAIVGQRSQGKQVRNGILLSGEPGNGKTVFAEALAGELRLPFLQLSHSDVASQWVGEKTYRITSAFAQARQQQPCVLFIDEVDSFLESRDGGRNDGTKEDRDVVNALLTLMVDIRKEKVILIAATNHIDRLDGAGIREGRFDFKVEITPPDREARVGLLTHGLKNQLPKVKVDPAVVEAVARRWNGFSVKRILAVTEELPSYLEREGKTAIAYEDFMGALRMLQGRKGSTPENVKPIAELVLSPATREMLDLIVGRMADPEHTESHGGTLPTGVLFYGPPGTGKTATAKALAKEIDWAFLPATGADLARDPKALEKLYAKAKELRPCVIFVDEADELLRSRDLSPNTEATNKLLTLMDGVNDRIKDVVWVAATNNPEQIDAALLRGGRFTEKVLFEKPSADGLATYLEAWFTSRKVALESGLTSALVAEMVGSESIANAEALVQAALNRAISRRSTPVLVTRADVEQAMRMIL
jgi:transitional endoplasmic reticulum ATPase